MDDAIPIGLTLRDDILPALGLQVREAASQLGVDRTTLSKMLNGRAAKVRLARQTAHDLWLAREAEKKSNALVRQAGLLGLAQASLRHQVTCNENRGFAMASGSIPKASHAAFFHGHSQ